MRTLREVLELMYEAKTAEDYRKIHASLELEVYGGAKITNSAHQEFPIVLVDFDGVINSYNSGFQMDRIPDDPIPGAIDWLTSLTFVFDVRIFSARCNDRMGVEVMQNWLLKHGLDEIYLRKIKFEPGKPSNHLIIDDRCVQFTGSFKDLDLGHIQAFRPWDRRPVVYKNPLEK